ncbi:unnamed protein product [Cochlearia groenlandica]
MESNVMFSGFSPRMLTLETPHNPPNPQNPVRFQHPHPHPKHLSPVVSLAAADDDDDRVSGSGSGCNPEDSGGIDGKRKLSQWHRMKWTDTMVRLLIMAVFYIGDEAGLTDQIETKRKTNIISGGGGGMLQKKGKWKSISKAMVEKGFSVSPQQCEDKFNDLNKRYKRVNDLLGKGVACRVVENQSLLETMDHLTPKLRDEVKRLLNSKHLFFREMCAYHNSCGHLSDNHHHDGQKSNPISIHAAAESEEDSESEMEDSESEETRKKKRKVEGESEVVKRIREEVARVMEDTGKSAWEKKEWIKRKSLETEEKKVGYEWEALEMEKQRVKWLRYRSKKERDMEIAKLENQRRMLETERIVLCLRRREIELTET